MSKKDTHYFATPCSGAPYWPGHTL